jgi:hypothetical protein
MSYYTEFFFRFTVNRDVPAGPLQAVLFGEGSGGEPLPDHPLFSTDRWEGMGRRGNLGVLAATRMDKDLEHNCWNVIIHGEMKDYDGEIGKFLDWIRPYLGVGPSDFIGYSIGEDSDQPTLHYMSDVED